MVDDAAGQGDEAGVSLGIGVIAQALGLDGVAAVGFGGSVEDLENDRVPVGVGGQGAAMETGEMADDVGRNVDDRIVVDVEMVAEGRSAEQLGDVTVRFVVQGMQDAGDFSVGVFCGCPVGQRQWQRC